MSGGQTSGSITLDLSGLNKALTENLGPALERINQNMARLARAVDATDLDQAGMAHVLSKHVRLTEEESQSVAANLLAAGYVLVQLPPARPEPIDDTVPIDPSLRGVVNDDWFERTD